MCHRRGIEGELRHLHAQMDLHRKENLPLAGVVLQGRIMGQEGEEGKGTVLMEVMEEEGGVMQQRERTESQTCMLEVIGQVLWVDVSVVLWRPFLLEEEEEQDTLTIKVLVGREGMGEEQCGLWPTPL